MIKKLSKDERGFIHWPVIFGVVFIFVLLFAIGLADYIYIAETKKRAHNTIDQVNRSIYSLIDIESVAFNVDIEVLNEVEAREVFEQKLEARFNLFEGSIANGEFTIQQFEVVNVSDLPYYDGYNNTMQEPGIISQVDIPIKTPFLGIEGLHPILVTTEVFRLVQE